MIKARREGILESVSYNKFAPVFRVFETYPFYESWTDEEIKDEYLSFQNGGYIYGYFTEDGKCVSILTMKPYELGKHPVNYLNDSKVIYLSDIATLPEYRQRGIATMLFEHAIKRMTDLGYDYIYLRTNQVNSMSYGIAVKCGFNEISNLTQDVERKRIDGVVEKDTRIFLEKKLSK